MSGISDERLAMLIDGVSENAEHPQAPIYWQEFANALRELQRLRSNAWQPIETAPRDGTEILIFIPDCDQAVASYQYGDDEDMAGWWGDGGFHYADPTHWQPLPAPPSDGGGR